MTSRQKIFGFMGAFLLSLSAGGTAWAATYYVATNGSDSAAGTESAPWKTIAYAVNKMVAGDTTYVRGGTYNESRLIWFKKSGTAAAPIKLLNAPGATPKISFTDEDDGILIAAGSGYGSNLSIGWINVEGFEITNGSVGFWVNNAHDVIIRRNWIHHAHHQGILGNGKNVLIDRNVINHVGRFAECARGEPDPRGVGGVCNKDHGIYTTGTNWTITNNLIYDNLASGIQMAGYPWCDDGECHGGGALTKTDRSFTGASGWLIANNTIAYNNYSPGIIVWKADATNSKFINNILYENGQEGTGDAIQGISFYNSGGGHEVLSNLFYATAPGRTGAIGGTTGWQGKHTESGNIVNTANPNFDGAGAAISGVPNFKLKAGSPAIDKGQNLLPLVTWDHQGIKRPAGAAFEIGAYEFCPPSTVCEQGSPPPNPTGGGGSFTPGVPVLLSPTGEICPSPYLPLQ